MSDADLEQIVASATRRNTANGITGMLLYADDHFMQLLEGEEALVDATFARVREDPRHGEVTVTERGPIASRSFANWSMGFKRMGREAMHALSAAVPAVAPNSASPATLAPSLAAAILSELARDAP
jgi:hypothetical protein